jgi:hypothetical protein
MGGCKKRGVLGTAGLTDYCSAAAYSQIGQHDNAVSDAREAISVDPSFSKEPRSSVRWITSYPPPKDSDEARKVD